MWDDGKGVCIGRAFSVTFCVPSFFVFLLTPKLQVTPEHRSRPFIRDAGYMRICNLFGQKVQIAYFSAYNGIFKIAYAENTPHMLKFAYIAQISAHAIAFFSILSDVWPRCLIILIKR